MKKVGVWFLNLSRVAQVSLVSVLALSGFFAAGASSSPTAPSSQQPSSNAQVISTEKKEPVVTTEIKTETQAIPFEKASEETTSMNKGDTRVERAGVNGVKTLTHTITLTDGVETKRDTTESVTTPPTSELTLIGTYVKPVSTCDENYSGCVPIVSYDLDCKDIGRSVMVYGYDRHGFDRDNDGYGCESY